MKIRSFVDKIRNDALQHPWTVLGWLITFLLTIYCLIPESIEVRYYIGEPQLIFDKASMPNSVRLIDSSGTIENPVYFTDVLLWNSGDLPIDQSLMRSTFKILEDSSSRIISMGVSEQTDPEVFKLRISATDHQLVLKWQHFDPGYRAKLFIVTESSTTPKFQVVGKALGMPNPINERTDSNRWILPIGFTIVFMMFTMVVTGLIMDRISNLFDYFKIQNSNLRAALFTLLLVGTIFGVGYVSFQILKLIF